MTHEEKLARWIRPGSIGVEIGAFKSPLPGLRPPPFYVDCFGEFGGEKVHADYYGHACLLPFRDNSLDYVVTSHVLEHVANPIAAFAEWHRVLRHGGIVYLLVPDRRFTWDRPRALTPVSHFLEDFEKRTTACDPTHIDDFVFGVDWASYSPDTPTGEIETERALRGRGMHEAVARGEEINIHFHTFEPANVLGLFQQLRTWGPARFDWEVVDHAERFPANNPIGFLAVARVNKPWRDRIAGWRNRRSTARDPQFPVLPDAVAFTRFTAKSQPPPPPIPGALDEPAETAGVAPDRFRVRGWLWHAPTRNEAAVVEARFDGEVIGETATLAVRADLAATEAVPPDAATSFDFVVPTPVKPGARFQLEVQARLSDGSRGLVANRQLTVATAEQAKKFPPPPIPGALDEPVDGAGVSAGAFRVRGWLWHAPTQNKSAVVQATVEGEVIAETATLVPRPDFTASRGADTSAGTGFDFLVPASAKLGATFQLEVHALLSDGTRGLVATRQLTVVPAEQARKFLPKPPPVAGSLDEPALDAVVDPTNIRVRGWFWDAASGNESATVEVWSDGRLLGKTNDLLARGDVAASLGLKADARVGFDFVLQATLPTSSLWQLDVEVLLKDGSRRSVATRQISTAPLKTTS